MQTLYSFESLSMGLSNEYRVSGPTQRAAQNKSAQKWGNFSNRVYTRKNSKGPRFIFPRFFLFTNPCSHDCYFKAETAGNSWFASRHRNTFLAAPPAPTGFEETAIKVTKIYLDFQHFESCKMHNNVPTLHAHSASTPSNHPVNPILNRKLVISAFVWV